MSDRIREMSGKELGNKLLKSVKEMKAGKAARVTKVAPNQVAAARLKTGLSCFMKFGKSSLPLNTSPRLSTLTDYAEARSGPAPVVQGLRL